MIITITKTCITTDGTELESTANGLMVIILYPPGLTESQIANIFSIVDIIDQPLYPGQFVSVKIIIDQRWLIQNKLPLRFLLN